MEKDGDKKFYEQLIACDNFLYFKHMMIKRNIQLQEEAFKLMSSKVDKNNDSLKKEEFTSYKISIIFFKVFNKFFYIFI